MKNVIYILFIIIFSGCAIQSAVTVDLTEFVSEIGSTLPNLSVKLILDDVPTQTATAIRGVTNWMESDGEGNRTGIMADSPHSLQLSTADLNRASLNEENKNSVIELIFSTPPLTVNAKRWNAKYLGLDVDTAAFEYISVGHNNLQIYAINDGYDYIYEVHATWNEGSALFTFRTTAN